jgi:hypothetical protein
MNHKREAHRDAEKLEGRYANYFKIGHNNFEFIIDFGQFYSEGKEAQLHTRIITSPNYAKGLLKTLRESIERHKQTFGAVHKEDEEDVR